MFKINKNNVSSDLKAKTQRWKWWNHREDKDLRIFSQIIFMLLHSLVRMNRTRGTWSLRETFTPPVGLCLKLSECLKIFWKQTPHFQCQGGKWSCLTMQQGWGILSLCWREVVVDWLGLQSAGLWSHLWSGLGCWNTCLRWGRDNGWIFCDYVDKKTRLQICMWVGELHLRTL